MYSQRTDRLREIAKYHFIFIIFFLFSSCFSGLFPSIQPINASPKSIPPHSQLLISVLAYIVNGNPFFSLLLQFFFFYIYIFYLLRVFAVKSYCVGFFAICVAVVMFLFHFFSLSLFCIKTKRNIREKKHTSEFRENSAQQNDSEWAQPQKMEAPGEHNKQPG